MASPGPNLCGRVLYLGLRLGLSFNLGYGCLGVAALLWNSNQGLAQAVEVSRPGSHLINWSIWWRIGYYACP